MVHEFKPKVWMTCPLCNKQSPMPDPDRKEWVGLTPEEIVGCATGLIVGGMEFAEAIEAKLKEKNT